MFLFDNDSTVEQLGLSKYEAKFVCLNNPKTHSNQSQTVSQMLAVSGETVLTFNSIYSFLPFVI